MHLADSTTKLCHGRKQDSAGWEGTSVNDCSRVEALFMTYYRDR